MDAAGAVKLRWRIEQQEHWRQAQSVLDGRQPASDPDVEELVSITDGLRIYAERVTRDRTVRVCKRLVDGVWEVGTIDGPFGEPDSSETATVAQVA